MNMPSKGGLYAITDCKNFTFEKVLEKTENILKVGIAILQYRNKSTDKKLKKVLAREIQILCSKYNTPFIINDDIELTKEINADGVHLGKDDVDINIAREYIGNKIVGISCYNDLNHAITAENSGANYIAFGSFFPSSTKPDAVKADINLIAEAKEQLTIPVVAIGGITPENAMQLINAKVDHLAVISGLYSANDTTEATLAYKNLFKS